MRVLGRFWSSATRLVNSSDQDSVEYVILAKSLIADAEAKLFALTIDITDNLAAVRDVLDSQH